MNVEKRLKDMEDLHRELYLLIEEWKEDLKPVHVIYQMLQVAVEISLSHVSEKDKAIEFVKGAVDEIIDLYL